MKHQTGMIGRSKKNDGLTRKERQEKANLERRGLFKELASSWSFGGETAAMRKLKELKSRTPQRGSEVEKALIEVRRYAAMQH